MQRLWLVVCLLLLFSVRIWPAEEPHITFSYRPVEWKSAGITAVQLFVRLDIPEGALPVFDSENDNFSYSLHILVADSMGQISLVKQVNRTLRCSFHPVDGACSDSVNLILQLPAGRYYLSIIPFNLPFYVEYPRNALLVVPVTGSEKQHRGAYISGEFRSPTAKNENSENNLKHNQFQ